MIRIALVDDHQLFRKSLASLLESSNDFDIIYDTDNGVHFLEYAQTENIDVVLLDIQMPILNGFEVCRRLKMINPDIKILIISLHIKPHSSFIIHHSLLRNYERSRANAFSVA